MGSFLCVCVCIFVCVFSYMVAFFLFSFLCRLLPRCLINHASSRMPFSSSSFSSKWPQTTLLLHSIINSIHSHTHTSTSQPSPPKIPRLEICGFNTSTPYSRLSISLSHTHTFSSHFLPQRINFANLGLVFQGAWEEVTLCFLLHESID